MDTCSLLITRNARRRMATVVRRRPCAGQPTSSETRTSMRSSTGFTSRDTRDNRARIGHLQQVSIITSRSYQKRARMPRERRLSSRRRRPFRIRNAVKRCYPRNCSGSIDRTQHRSRTTSRRRTWRGLASRPRMQTLLRVENATKRILRPVLSFQINVKVST